MGGKNGRYLYYSEYTRYTKTFAIENSSLFFQIWNLSKNILCVLQKKYCNQNKYQINQNLVLRVWFALPNSRHKNIFQNFGNFWYNCFYLPKLPLAFVYSSKNSPKISFPNVK